MHSKELLRRTYWQGRYNRDREGGEAGRTRRAEILYCRLKRLVACSNKENVDLHETLCEYEAITL